MLIFYQKNKINFKIKEIINLNQISNQELLTGNLVDKNCYDFIKNNIKGIMELQTTIQNLKVNISYAFFNKKRFQ